jgi:hypothetical protein
MMLASTAKGSLPTMSSFTPRYNNSFLRTSLSGKRSCSLTTSSDRGHRRQAVPCEELFVLIGALQKDFRSRSLSGSHESGHSGLSTHASPPPAEADRERAP